MICTNGTKQECLDKGLLGERESLLPYMRTIKKGDVGFLLNVSKDADELLGVFIAESQARLNIDPKAWNGQFPAQVKVKLDGELKTIKGATDKLKNIIELKEIKKNIYHPYKVPSKKTYGPEITKKVLSLFEIPEFQKGISSQPEDIDIFPETSMDDVSMDDVAGLDDVKDFIYKRIIAPFENEDASYKLKLRIGGGMLLFGPPGTGKTLIAKAISNSIQAKYIEISPSIIMGYPGEAENHIEKIFVALDKEPRAVIFLDEAEWILGKRQEQGSTVMQRITPELLSQLSRIFKQKTKQIVVIAATNMPQNIDPAFLRPGRFDRSFYIRLPDKNAREHIIKLQLDDRPNQINDSDISEIAEKLDGYSGADIEYIVEESAYKAFENIKPRGDAIITKDDIMKVIEKTSKSVTSEDVQEIEKWMEERGLKI